MAQTIVIRRGTSTPTIAKLKAGEMAVNVITGRLFVRGLSKVYYFAGTAASGSPFTPIGPDSAIAASPTLGGN